MASYMVEQRNSNQSCTAKYADVRHPAQAGSGGATAYSGKYMSEGDQQLSKLSSGWAEGEKRLSKSGAGS
jgi:hypothetical protein